MKKKILCLIAFSMIVFGVNSNIVSATTIVGDDTPGVGITDNNAEASSNMGTGIGSCPNGLCAYNNANEAAVQVSISYVDNNGMTNYHTEAWTNNPSAAGTVTSNGQVMVYKDFLPKGGDYLAVANAIDSYFLSNSSANANDWYNKYADTSKSTQDANAISAAEYGTRIISTPVLRFNDHGSTNYLTVKEVATRYDELTNKGRFEAIATLFTTEYADVGIIGPDGNLNPLFVASLMNGYGYNIIDFLKGFQVPRKRPVQPTCPGGSMNLNNAKASCNQAVGGLTYTYSYTAGAGSQANIHRQYGIDQNAPGTGAYCKLYCQERGTATLPGALAGAVQLGSYIIWPTSQSNTTNKFTKADDYPLKFSGKKTCKLVLMPDHNNFPGNGCLQDPVAEYNCIYNGQATPGSTYTCTRTYNNSIKHIGTETKDYKNVLYENVRIANKNYFNEPEYCGTEKYASGTLKSSGKAGRGTYQLYDVKQTNQYYNSDSYGQANYSYYKDLINKIKDRARDAVNACNQVTQDVLDTANISGPAEECHWQIGEFKWTSGICPHIAEARRKVSACHTADARYGEAVDATEEIENSIKACRLYITDFNYARNILNEIGLCGNFSASGDEYYHFSSKASMSYNNGEYSVSGKLEKESSASIGCQGQCSGLGFKEKPQYPTFASLDTAQILAGKVAQIENRTIEFTAETDVYKSNSNYSYINKKLNKYSTSRLDSNYLEIKSNSGGLAKVLPTDYNAPILDSNQNAKKYTLNLMDTAFGENNRFVVTNSGDYVCEYTVAKRDDGCVCPQDSKMPGKDLMKHVAEDPISCADAQQKYCDSGEEEPYDKLYCPDMKTPLTGCLKTGIGYQRCVDLVCPGSYKCKNTNGLRTGMDITDCVQTKLAQGKTVEQALDYCDSVVCPIGKTIIYRTIKLENPFPGKNISKIVQGFNNDVKGRYPGANWNGVLTVYNKIRNNRETDTNSTAVATNTNSTSGTTIYQTKQPLYTFVLNGVTIKNIRDYNDKQKDGYNDFTLECKTKNSSGCISYKFVHNSSLSGLVSGTCKDISLNNGFYACAE